jgi:hypothetical protein
MLAPYQCFARRVKRISGKPQHRVSSETGMRSATRHGEGTSDQDER